MPEKVCIAMVLSRYFIRAISAALVSSFLSTSPERLAPKLNGAQKIASAISTSSCTSWAMAIHLVYSTTLATSPAQFASALAVLPAADT
ncbi:hypothetical protein GCM10009639_68630 [Kitasatospora putterlickiae]|uniref:Secreted protein n=1 Tax=Kitasatospora putterlickiae TaxID=221725 RepID=A0ABN1YIF9_9ACTN